MHVTALAGGVGGAKLLVGLQRALADPRSLTAVVNTGDDDDIYGLRVSPDVDIVTYWLAGMADTERGWGLLNDRFTVVESLAALGMESWFRLGDRDLATCLFRTIRLAQGAALSSVTSEIAGRFGVKVRILPMSDDRVATTIRTVDGRVLSFQEYFVRERTHVAVAEIRYEGADSARPAPGVLDALDRADVVVVCPSNPLLSIGPIVRIPGIEQRLIDHPHVVAVSPLVKGRALKGPADRLLKELGYGADAAGVARMYARFCNTFVLDRTDASLARILEASGLRAIALDTIMTDPPAAERLATELLTA